MCFGQDSDPRLSGGSGGTDPQIPGFCFSPIDSYPELTLLKPERFERLQVVRGAVAQAHLIRSRSIALDPHHWEEFDVGW